ncbi:hypothetical protein DL762_007600 [Monosporascus cannonballus]|uniref:C3H1-type domain-containing protein n=1 Tax=Monosporascus cannonballus TaxID=155416 RepID=A0ABY0H2V3_9PEZI|nr:hypothetical protein DL762_007600 [Monosporascus cannonballus]
MDLSSQDYQIGDHKPVIPKPCRYFQGGKCRYGASCKFLHTSRGDDSRSETQSRSGNDFNKPGEDGLREWRRLLRQGPSRSTCGKFFQLAHDLMDGDVGAAQEAIKLLAQDEGLSFIRHLAETQIPKGHDRYSKLDLWHIEIQPFFKLITHPKLLDSAVLESEVATIYNFMQGIGGRRMKTIFDFVAGLPDSAATSSSAVADTSSLVTIELSLAVLAKMVDCNTTNIVNDNVKSVFRQFRSSLDTVRQVPDDFLKLQAQKYAQYIQRRLDVGDGLSDVTRYQQPIVHAEFVIRRDLPGHLSAEGPRHDNDHAEISKIRIMPTYDEIISPRKEYLPTNDSSLFHLPGIRGRLDREFRLLREDTVGQLRDAVRSQLNALQPPGTNLPGGNKDSLRTHVYQDARIYDISISRRQGLDLLVQFRQAASSKEAQKRREWWSHSKRLQPGGFVCLITNEASVLFCVVADSTIVASNDRMEAQQNTEDSSQATEQRQSPSLADNNELAYVHLHLAEPVPDNVTRALRWYRSSTPAHRRFIVEFPGVLLPSFQYTLEALQELSKRPDLPFADLLAPTPGGCNQTQVPPPQYATRRNFSFDLSCLTQGNSTLRCSTSRPLDPQALTRHSILDETQSSALLDTLSRSLTLIQGPPGTGKSFTGEKIIQVLLANKADANLGPILCVCYTNHALDQLLEHLHDQGVKGIIRIGSKSKSERLKSINLRLVAQREDRSKAEKRALWENGRALDDHVQHMTDLLDQLRTCHSTRALEKYLADKHPKHHDELLGKDEDGFQTVFRRQNQGPQEWMAGGRHDASAPRPIGNLLEANLWAMTNAERILLRNYWQRDMQSTLEESIIKEHQLYAQRKGLRDRVLREVDLRCLSEADVVGVTTTGLARNMDLLRKLRCKVMLCEEAGEVLEAHILTAFLPSVEHAILIGDHLQLRPQIQNYDLQSTNPRGAKYSLDVSLFERLVNPPHENERRLPFNTLETQRRMHPSIADLVRQTLYPSLIDGGAVREYPDVLGMKRRLFWLHHEHPEDRASQLDPTTTSHSNNFEVEMIIALVQHLVRQGEYGPDDIAVITPYLGQFQRLRRRMDSLFELSVGDRDLEELQLHEARGSRDQTESDIPVRVSARKTALLKSIRLATVDNFQGEEAKVVVVSLVRSNSEAKCGFLPVSRLATVNLRARSARRPARIAAVIRGAARNAMSHVRRVPSSSVRLVVHTASAQCRPSICGEICPAAKYCQRCCIPEIKSTAVDFILGMQYHEIDLDEDPCIFPDCGHFTTKSNMDGIMDMKAHYHMSDDGNPIAIAKASKPFSMKEVKVCPICRGSLRNIGRYGRIVRRAMLDEATKKFIAWSESECLKLVEGVVNLQRSLSESPHSRALERNARPTKIAFSTGRLKQLHMICDWLNTDRYSGALSLWHKISAFVGQVRKEEQPFQRVADFVRYAARQREVQGDFDFDSSELQVKGYLQASALWLKCETIIFSDFLGVRKELGTARPKIKVDFSKQFKDCEALIKLAISSKYPRQEVEGHIYFTQFLAFARALAVEEAESTGASSGEEQAEKLRVQATDHLASARRLVERYPSTKLLKPEIDAVEVMLRDGVFYQKVSADEMRAVYEAMRREFHGAGHWYTCRNGHPFTVGECGMPMEQARCPECGEAVGGRSHMPAEGVQRADEIEDLARNIDRMDI